MKIVRLIFIFILSFCSTMVGLSQITKSNATTYSVDVFGSAATGSNTPFWITSNQYGVVPLEAGNGYLRPIITHNQEFGKGFYWSAGIDILAIALRYKNIYIQQLFAEIGYKSFLLSIGSKENYNSLWDKKLSTGDMIQSANARPIPEINISIPEFTAVPLTNGWFQIKGNLAIGRSFDTNYLRNFIQTEQFYTQKVLWHHKSAFFRIKDPKSSFPIYASFGLRHIAQWGGTSTNSVLGKQPQSLKDLVRIFFLKSGGDNASISDKTNVLGAHHISYDFQLGFIKEKWAIQAYYQHICADKSGVLFYNGTDGLWGIQLDLHDFPWINKVVVEYINTRNQSGPFHFIDFDHDLHSGRGGGGDDYYNNVEYTTGNSYFNRSIGSPLLPSPEYNIDGSLGFQNTRVKDWHIGLEGTFLPQLTYRTFFTVMNGWGVPNKPFLRKKHGTSLLLELNYSHPRLSGWMFSGALAGDTGNMLGKESFGLSLGIKKQGILKTY